MIRSTQRSLVFVLFAILALLPHAPSDLYAFPPVERLVLPNGLVVLTAEDHSLPFVTLTLLLDAGAKQDPEGKEGLAHIAGRMLLAGTKGMTTTALFETLDSMGASLNASPNRDYVTVNLRALSKDFERTFGLLMASLAEPAFPEDELKTEVSKTLAALKASEEDPGTVAAKAFQKALYASAAYAHPVAGTEESVRTIRRDDVVAFFNRYYRAQGAILSIVGDIDPDTVRRLVIPGIEKLETKVLPAAGGEARWFTAGKGTIAIDRSITQANIIVGTEGVARSNPDYYALSVMNYILGGGGFSSRLMEDIRNKRGLAYSVGSFFDVGKHPGSFQVVLQTKNSSAREAVEIVMREIGRIAADLVSEEELEDAKKYLTGSFPLRLDTQGKLAGFLTQVEYFGLGLDYVDRYPTIIRSITRERILEVARKYLSGDSWLTVVVANLKEAQIEAGPPPQ
jgi:zinc protease